MNSNILLNQAFKMLVLTALAQRTVWCQYHGDQFEDGHNGQNEELHQDYHVKPLYKFGYWVHDPKTNDVKNHWEHRDGDAVHGSYSLLQPDGHVRVVEYTADKHNGFNAHVKYMYDGHGGGGGGDGYNGHTEDAAGGRSQIGGGDGGRPKQQLSKFYKKPRTEKPGGPPGQYRKPHHHFDGRPKTVTGVGGGGFKKQRFSAAEQSADYYNRPNGHFDQLPRFQSNPAGGSGHDRYRANSAPGLPFGYGGGEQGADQPSENFAQKYSALASGSPAAADKSGYFPSIQHQSSEYELVHRRPDATPPASAEYRHRGSSEEQQRHQQPPPSRPQRSHNDEYGPVDEHDNRSLREQDDGDDEDDVVKIQKQPLREYHFEEPYPFEKPENLHAASGNYRTPHQRSLPQPVRRHASVSPYFPVWYGNASDDSNERPEDY